MCLWFHCWYRYFKKRTSNPKCAGTVRCLDCADEKKGKLFKMKWICHQHWKKKKNASLSITRQQSPSSPKHTTLVLMYRCVSVRCREMELWGTKQLQCDYFVHGRSLDALRASLKRVAPCSLALYPPPLPLPTPLPALSLFLCRRPCFPLYLFTYVRTFLTFIFPILFLHFVSFPAF